MPGVPEFNRITQISANPGITVQMLSGSSTAVLGSGSVERMNVFSAPGTVSKLKNANIYFNPITEAVSGTKRITVDLYDGTKSVGICYVEAAYNATLGIVYMIPSSATVQGPTTDQIFQNQLKDQEFDSVVGLSIIFTNSTPSNTVQQRFYNLMVSRLKTS